MAGPALICVNRLRRRNRSRPWWACKARGSSWPRCSCRSRSPDDRDGLARVELKAHAVHGPHVPDPGKTQPAQFKPGVKILHFAAAAGQCPSGYPSSYSQHLTVPAVREFNERAAPAHRAKRAGHRSAKRHPWGGSIKLGGWPGMNSSSSPPAAWARWPSAFASRDARRFVVKLGRRWSARRFARRTSRPHRRPVRWRCAMSWVMRMNVVPNSFDPLQDVHQVGLGEHVQRRRGLVQDDDSGLGDQRHGDRHPLAHAAAQLKGITVEKVDGHARRPGPLPGPASSASCFAMPARWTSSGSAIWSAILTTGLRAFCAACGTSAILVQRTSRRNRSSGRRHDVLPVEDDRGPGTPGRCGEAAAGSPWPRSSCRSPIRRRRPGYSALPSVEAHVVYGLQIPWRGAKVQAEVFDLEKAVDAHRASQPPESWVENAVQGEAHMEKPSPV